MLAARGTCVALDAAALRWRNDLDAPYGVRVCASCRLDVGEEPDTCPRCGDRVGRRAPAMGMIA
jgi:hypothetical protein